MSDHRELGRRVWTPPGAAFKMASPEPQDSDADTIIIVDDGDSHDEQEEVPVVENDDPRLGGPWGPIRLFLDAHLDDVNRCVSWCVELGIIRDLRTCRVHRRPMDLKKRSGWSCLIWYCGKCDKRRSVLENSIFSELHSDLGTNLLLALSFAKGYSYEVTRDACCYDGGPRVTNRTIAGAFNRFRARLRLMASSNSAPWIGGPGVVVQIDECKLGRSKYDRGRRSVAERCWVFGMVDANGELHLELVPNRSKETLVTILRRVVKRGSIIHSDEWKGYSGLALHGFIHFTVNHSQEFIHEYEEGLVHTQRIESTWRHLRRMFTPGGRRLRSFEDYLVEFMWRRKCSIKAIDPFRDFLRCIKINQ